MGLEKAGELYISKKGKGVMIKIDSRRVRPWPIYFVCPRKTLRALLDNHVGTVPLSIIVADHKEKFEDHLDR